MIINKTKLRTVLVLTLVLTVLIAMGSSFIIFAAASDSTAYETFDDYDTARDRKDTGGSIFEQMMSWSGNALATVAMEDRGVAPNSNRSLKISNGNNESASSTFYSNGSFAKIDQTGAKYIKWYIENLSGADKQFGIMLTDIWQQSIATGDIKNDSGQEHWQLKWNAVVVLETLEGVKSSAISTDGLAVTIPKDFKGSINVPINKKTLTIPSWFLAENPPQVNNIIDLDKVFMVSSIIPGYNANAVFLTDDIYFKNDSVIDDYILSLAGENQADAESIIRPNNSSFTVNYKKGEIVFKSKITKREFVESFSLPSGYEIVLHDDLGMELLSDDETIDNGFVATFTDKKQPFTYDIRIEGEKETKACGTIDLSGFLPLGGIMLLAIFAVAVLKKKVVKV